MKNNIPIHERINDTISEFNLYIPHTNVESIYTPAGNNSKNIQEFYNTPIDTVKKLCYNEIENIYLTIKAEKFNQSKYFNQESNKGSLKQLISENKE